MANKTRRDRRQLLRNFLGEGDLNKGRRLGVVTTGDGAADGTTVVSTNLKGLDTSLIGAYLKIDSVSDSEGEERLITAFVDSSGTATVTPAFTVLITGTTTKVDVQLFERGKYSDLELENNLLQAEYTLAQTLDPNNLFSLTKTFECSLTNGVVRRDTLLSDMVKLIAFTDISRTTIFRILPVTELQNLQNVFHPDFATTSRPAAVQAGTPANDRFGDYWIYPSDIATVEAIYIKAPTDYTTSAGTETSISDIDDRFERLVIFYAAYLSTGEERFLQQYQANVQILQPELDTPLIGYEGARPQRRTTDGR